MGKHSKYKAIPDYENYYKSDAGLITFRKRINGSQITISTGSTSIKEARKIVDDKLVERFSANPKAEKRKRKGITNPFIQDVWDDLMDERKIASEKSTQDGYRSSWKYGMEPFFKNYTVKQLSPALITQWENWYLKENPTRVFFNTEKHFTMLLGYLKRQRMIDEVWPIRDLDEIIVKTTKKEKVGRVYTDAEMKAFFEHAVNLRTKVGLKIYRFMGCRKNEVLKSELAKWDLKKQQATIWSFKNKKWRTIPIPDVVMPDLLEWIKLNKHRESKFLFPADQDASKHISSQVFDKSWTKTKRLTGMPDWNEKNAARIHDLRHTFATQTKDDGWHPLVACKVLDMSLKEYQKTYVHITTDEITLLMKKSFKEVGHELDDL